MKNRIAVAILCACAVILCACSSDTQSNAPTTDASSDTNDVAIEAGLVETSPEAETSIADFNKPLPAAPNLPSLYGLPSGLQQLMVVGDEPGIVPIIGDDSNHGLYLSSSSFGDDPSWSAIGVNNNTPALFGGQVTGSNVADWKGLHDDGVTVLFRTHPTGAMHGQIIGTTRSTLTTPEPGLLIGYDGNVNHRFYVVTYNDNGIALNVIGASGTAPPNNPYTVLYRADSNTGGELRINGSGYATANYTAPTSTANPGQALRLNNATGLSGFNHNSGATSLLAWWNRRLTDTESTQVESVANTTASLRATLTVRALGDSITQNASSWRRGFWMAVTESAGWRVDFVGSRPPGGNFPLADGDHDGFAGQKISEIAARIADGPDCTDLVVCAGTNNMGGSVEDALADMSKLIDTAKSYYATGTRIWIFAIPYGTGETEALTLAGKAGAYNAALKVLCKQKDVHFIDTHAGSTPWIPSLHAIDSVAHPSLDGGEAMGRTAAETMGIVTH